MISIIFVSIFIHTFKYEYRNVIWGEKFKFNFKNYEFIKQSNKNKIFWIDQIILLKHIRIA